MIWQLQETWALQIDFFDQFCPVKSRESTQQDLLGLHQIQRTLVWLQVFVLFGDPITLQGLVHFLNTTGPSLTIVVDTYFDLVSYTYVPHLVPFY